MRVATAPTQAPTQTAARGILPTIAVRDEAGRVARISIGWIILAYNIFGICYVLGATSGEALFYLVGGAISLLLLAPFWRHRPRYLLIAFALYLVVEDALLAPFYKHAIYPKLAPDVIIFAVLAWRILVHLRHRRILLTGIELPLMATLAVAAASTFFNHTPLSVAGQGIYTLLRYAAVFLLAAQCNFTRGDLRALIRFVTFVAMAESAIGLLQFLLLHRYDFQLFGYFFVQGTTSYFNVLGAFLAIACVLALATYTTKIVPRPRLELCILLGLSALTITLALSRQSLAMLAIGWVVAGFLGRKKTPLIQLWRPLAYTAVGVALGLVMVWLGSKSAFQQRSTQAVQPSAPVVAHIASGANIASHPSLMHTSFSVLSPALGMRLANHAISVAPIVTVTPSPAADATPDATPSTTPEATATATPMPTATATPTPTSGGGHPPQQTKSSRIFDTTLKGKLKQLGPDFFSTDFHVNARMYEIVNGGEAIMTQSPLLGLGPGTFGGQSTFHDKSFYERLNVGLLLSDPQHNYVTDVEWMNVFGQLGLLGLLGFLWMFVALARIAWRAYRQQRADTTIGRLALACVAFVPMFLFAGFTGPNFEVRAVIIWLWLIAGVVVAAGQQGRLIRLDRTLFAQLRAPRVAEPEPAETDMYAAVTVEPRYERPTPTTWQRALPPRWSPRGPSGEPPVRPFWNDESAPPPSPPSPPSPQ